MDDQFEHYIRVCLELKNRISNDSNVIKPIITVDETRIYGYDSETKVQSSQWKSASSSRSKKRRHVCSTSNVKAMFIVFFDFFGLVQCNSKTSFLLKSFGKIKGER